MQGEERDRVIFPIKLLHGKHLKARQSQVVARQASCFVSNHVDHSVIGIRLFSIFLIRGNEARECILVSLCRALYSKHIIG